MPGVALDIDEDYAQTTYGYQINESENGFKIWMSTGPLRGEHIGGEFEEFIDALEYLARHLRDGEI